VRTCQVDNKAHKMKSIDVRPRHPSPSYGDVNAAILAATQENRKRLPIHDSGLRGCILSGIFSTESTCELSLDDRCLSIGIDPVDMSLIWNMVSMPKSAESGQQETVLLGMANTQFIWDRHSVIAEIVGRRFDRLFYNGTDLYVYFSDDRALCFSSFITFPDNSPFLFWSIAD